MRLVITIPAYNEELTIAKVIKEIPRKISGISDIRVIVIDDGSRDETVNQAREAGADRIISFPLNRGLGSAFRAGLEAALDEGADYIVNTDADLQYDQTQIPDLLRPLQNRLADIVLGSRFKGQIEDMPVRKRIANRFVSWIVRITSGYPISDAQTGFRAFSREAALWLHVSGGYTYVQETILQAAQRKLAIQEVPIRFRKREGESRLIASLSGYATKAGPTILSTYRDYHPLHFFGFFATASAIAGVLFLLLPLLITGSITSYVPVIAGLFLASFITMIAGIVADSLKTERLIQEEILYRIKQLRTDPRYRPDKDLNRG